MLAGVDATIQTKAFEYGRQLGIAYQLTDELLNFSVDASTQNGKAVAVDLNQGLANISVLFAAQQVIQFEFYFQNDFRNPDYYLRSLVS